MLDENSDVEIRLARNVLLTRSIAAAMTVMVIAHLGTAWACAASPIALYAGFQMIKYLLIVAGAANPSTMMGG